MHEQLKKIDELRGYMSAHIDMFIGMMEGLAERLNELEKSCEKSD